MTDAFDPQVPVARPAMGISHDDFFRVFPTLVATAVWRREGLAIHVRWPQGAQLVASVSPQKLRRIASLSLPYVDVELSFRGMSDSERDVFLKRFDRAFQKGGG